MSPADGLVEPYFDYLIGVQTPSINEPTGTPGASEGRRGSSSEGGEALRPDVLGRILEENEGKQIGLRVYNTKSQRIRGE